MEAKTPARHLEERHKPCAFNPSGASKQECERISGQPQSNLGGCTRSKCKCPWRLCAACILQGGERRPVAKPGSRLCAFHAEHGESAIPPKTANPVAAAMPKRHPESAAPAKTVLPPAREVGSRTFKVETEEEGRAILDRARIAISNAVYEVVDIKRIRAMPNQPRKYFNPERLLTLSDSLKSFGQMMPGFLRYAEKVEDKDLEIVDGERRWRACLIAGVETYRAMTMVVDDEAAQYIMSALANFNREGHTPLEIADSIRVMHEDLKQPLSTIASSMGFSPMYVSNLYGLRRLAPEVRSMLDPEIEHTRKLPVTAAVEIARLPVEHQNKLALAVIHKEVKVTAVRAAVVRLSQAEGFEIAAPRAIDPNKQRLSIQRRMDELNDKAKALVDQVKRTHKTILGGFSQGSFVDLAAQAKELQAKGKVLEQTFTEWSKK